MFYTILISLIAIFAYLVSMNVSSKQYQKIFSPIVISHTAKVSVNVKEPMEIDKDSSLRLTEFISYTNRNKKHTILMGPIFSEKNDLDHLCKNPTFLVQENIHSAIPSGLTYFKKPYQGCFFTINQTQSAAIITHPNPFTDLQGRAINFVGIITESNRLTKTLSQISFKLSAKDYYISLLQIGSTFSPFAMQLNWQAIKQAGLNYIGKDKSICKGTYAAAQYFVPKLREIDHHTFISLDGLGSKDCPMPKVRMDTGMERWLAVPIITRNKIVEYSQHFHGKHIGKISYVYIPAIEAYSPDKINQAVAQGRKALADAKIVDASGIIIDLRFNTGGDEKSMLLTLGGLLPEGNVFGLDKNSFVKLSSDGNTLLLDNITYGQYTGGKPKKIKNIPVAILANWLTGSSAEITALSLKTNLKDSRLFGTDTSGALSTNQSFFLWDENVLNLMFTRIYKRDGKVAALNLTVDQEVHDQLESTFSDSDPVINSAIDWLRKK